VFNGWQRGGGGWQGGELQLAAAAPVRAGCRRPGAAPPARELCACGATGRGGLVVLQTPPHPPSTGDAPSFPQTNPERAAPQDYSFKVQVPGRDAAGKVYTVGRADVDLAAHAAAAGAAARGAAAPKIVPIIFKARAWGGGLGGWGERGEELGAGGRAEEEGPRGKGG
jgi:hypothetical protein